MKDGLLQQTFQKIPCMERYGRLVRVYLLKQHSVKRIWSYAGDLNEYRLARPDDLLRGYFLDFSRDADYPGPFDSYDIPLLDYHGAIGIRYNPWSIGHYALASFQKYLQTKNKMYFEHFLKCAQWFVDNAELRKNGSAVWSYEYSLVTIHTTPWISALAQAHAISVLLTAFLLTGNQRFRDAAKKAFVPFTMPIECGGVLTIDSQGDLFFEEDSSLLVPHVLNGFLFAMLGIYDYATVMKDDNAWALWKSGLKTLRRYLYYYDTGYFSLYNLHEPMNGILKNASSMFYHFVHIQQLWTLFFLTDEVLFKDFATRWTAYSEDKKCRLKAYIQKATFKLLMY